IEGMKVTVPIEVPVAKTPDLNTILLSLIPSNPFVSFVEGNMIQIIVFASLFGIAINLAGEKGKPIASAIESLAHVMSRLTAMVMQFAPIGVFAMMAWVVGSFGDGVLKPLMKFLMTFYMASFAYVVIVICGMLRFMVQVNPLPFFKGMGQAIMVAFSTCSSSG